VTFGNAYFPAAVFTIEFNDSRIGRYSDYLAALRAFSPPADVLVVNPDFMSTVFAEKPNHKAFSLVSALIVLQS
jgi:hypothetical protein